MKKLLLTLLCVPLIFSCGEKEDNKSDEISVSAIDNPCDYMDSVKIVIDKVIDITQKYTMDVDRNDMIKSDLKKFDRLKKRFEELRDLKIKNNWGQVMFEDCQNYNEVMLIVKKIPKKLMR